MGKSFNPFKMWGSYFGAFVGVIFHLFFNHGGNLDTFFTLGLHIVDGYAYFFSGFLIGWGIHSLVRVVRN